MNSSFGWFEGVLNELGLLKLGFFVATSGIFPHVCLFSAWFQSGFARIVMGGGLTQAFRIILSFSLHLAISAFDPH